MDVVMFSGGAGSWATAKAVAEQNGTENLLLLFADTLIEDEDTYRFLIEGAANVFGITAAPALEDLKARARALTPVEANDMPRRQSELAGIAGDAMALIGRGFVWVADGRDPWRVFEDRRFIGNTRVDPCSEELKRELLRTWIDTHLDPSAATIYIGIDWTEEHRFTKAANRWLPWVCKAPLCDNTRYSKEDLPAVMRENGLEAPRLYAMGFAHGNCGGFCVKAGQAHFANLLRVMPGRYRYHEEEEEAFREREGKNVSILRDRRGGTTKPLTMRDFRERVQGGEEFDQYEWGGCACFSG